MRKSRSISESGEEPEAKKPFRPFEEEKTGQASAKISDDKPQKPKDKKEKKKEAVKKAPKPPKVSKKPSEKKAKKKNGDVMGILTNGDSRPDPDVSIKPDFHQDKLKYLRYFRLGTHRKRNGVYDRLF